MKLIKMKRDSYLPKSLIDTYAFKQIQYDIDKDSFSLREIFHKSTKQGSTPGSYSINDRFWTTFNAFFSKQSWGKT